MKDKMKEKILYECETCHTVYADKDKAYDCEHGHKAISEITDAKYLPMKTDVSGLPKKICIKFEDQRVLVQSLNEIQEVESATYCLEWELTECENKRCCCDCERACTCKECCPSSVMVDCESKIDYGPMGYRGRYSDTKLPADN